MIYIYVCKLRPNNIVLQFILFLEVIFEKRLNLVVSYTQTEVGCIAQVLCVDFTTKIVKSELCARLSLVCNSRPNWSIFRNHL